MKTGICVLSVLVACVLILQACAPIPIFPEDPTLTPLLPSETPVVPTATPILSSTTPVPTDKPAVAMEKNIVPGKPVTASRNLNTNLPKMAIDSKFDTWWGAGAFAPQWIEINLEGYYTITKIKLTPSQSPSGDTVHRILGRGVGGKYHILHTFEQFTQDGMVLQVIPDEPWEDISSIRIETVSSPSWVSWREIMIFSREEPKALNDMPLPTKSSDLQGVIAYYTKIENVGGIGVIRADGSSDTILLSILIPNYDSNHSWSLDGSKIVFNAFRDDVANRKHMDIYIMNADGSHLTRVTNTDGWYTDPEWSQDGRQLVVAAQKDGESNLDLYILELASGIMTRLTEDSASDRNPSWSPDGSKIVFASDRGGEWNIYIIDVNTGAISQLTRNTGNSYQPDLSPDGKRILFSARRDEHTDIYVMNVDGSKQTQLTNSPGDDWDPEWSPDGKYFAYASGDKDHSNIYIANLDTSVSWLLFEDDNGYRGSPAWSGTAVISDEPMFGPVMCMRDTNGDFKPDTVTNTFSTTDQFPYIMFPHRKIDPSVVMSIFFNYEKSNMDAMNTSLKWEYDENGLYVSGPSGVSLSALGGAQNLTIQVLLNGEVVQEIECPIVSQTLESTAVSTRTPTATTLPTLTPTVTRTPTPKPTSTPVTYLPEGFHDGNKGTVDSASCSAFGWAVDPDDRKRDLRIQVLSDGILVSTTTANLLRSDVGACTGGTCGFNVSLWGMISTGEQHRITVQAYDEENNAWVDLSYTSKLLTCQGYPEGNHDGSEGLVDQAGCAADGWVVDPDDRSEDVTVQVLSDGIVIAEVVAGFYRPDLNKPNMCIDGTCGFRVDLWNLISHNDRHSIRVKALDAQTDTWHDLDYTPKILTCGN